MNAFQQLITQRQSIRRYTDAPLDEEQLATIVEAGLRAPSSRGLKPWHFIVVDSPYLLHQLSECKPSGASFVEKAAVAIVLVADATQSDTWIEDCSVAHTLMWLQAEALGLGACWVQLLHRTQTDGTLSSQLVSEILNIPPHLQVHSLLSIGHTAQKRRVPLSQEQLLWEKVHFNTLTDEADITEQTLL